MPLAGSLDFYMRSAYLSAKGLMVRAIKNGKMFYRVLEDLEKSQWYSVEELQSLQDKKLRALIHHAYQNVPYYRRVFDKHGIKPHHIQTADDLKKIPCISKQTLKEHGDAFVDQNVSKRTLASGWTTGSTGTPTKTLRSMNSIAFEKATLVRYRRWAGVDIHDRKVAVWGTIWGNVIVPRLLRSPPFWRFNAADNQALFSYYHLSDETLPTFINELRAFRPRFIEGFPSTMLMLARFLRKQNDVLPVQAVLTTSEPLFAAHRHEIEQSFQAKVYDSYGQSERVVSIAECEHGGLHSQSEYGVIELLQGERSAPFGERGEIVGTGLNNFAMPLIRYRTGDISHFVKDPCPCGRYLPLVGSIDGRLADFIRTPDGRIMPGDGVMEAFYGLDNIKKSLVIQEAIDHIVVKIVKDDQKNSLAIDSLTANLRRCLGNGIRIDVDCVDTIPHDGRIKNRWVVSKIEKTLD